MNQAYIKTITTFVGKFLGVVGLIYILYTLSQEYTWQSFIHKLREIINIIPLLIFLNVLSIILGIFAWHTILLHYTSTPFNYLISYYYFAKTEIAKYLPGNVFHFIGRQAIATKVGINQKQMAHTSFLFTFFILVSTIFATLCFSLFANPLPPYITILLFIASLITIIIIFKMYASFSIIQKSTISLYLTLSVALQGFMLGLIIMHQIDTFDTGLFFLLISIYIISWLIGFVTPGASGGLGVREGAFITISHFLHITIDTDIIIFSILLVRLINILVDILLYLSTYIIHHKIAKDIS